MARRYLAALIVILTILGCETTMNATNSNLEVLRLIEVHGMNALHAGKDYFQLKKPLRSKGVELQNVRIYNLKSMYRGCALITKRLSPRVTVNSGWKIDTQCFSLTWCVGFQKLRVEAQSKLTIFFNTKIFRTSSRYYSVKVLWLSADARVILMLAVFEGDFDSIRAFLMGNVEMFHDVMITINPLILRTQLKICFPFVEPLTPPKSNTNSPANSSCDAAFSMEVTDVDFMKWDGIRLKGTGTFNKIAAVLINTGIFDQLIRKEIQKKMKNMLPEKFTNLRQKICNEIDRLVKQTIERYAVKPPQH